MTSPSVEPPAGSHSTRLIVIIVSLVVLLGCGGAFGLVALIVARTADEPAKISEHGTARVEPGATDSSVVSTPSSAAPSVPSAADLGDTVVLGDWSVRVTKIELNATETMHRANEFNDRARGQYVLVTYLATYTGDKRTMDAEFELTWSFTGVNQRVYYEASQVTPADTQEWPTEVRTGGTVKSQVVFDLPPDQIHGGLVSVAAYDSAYDEVYADFSVD